MKVASIILTALFAPFLALSEDGKRTDTYALEMQSEFQSLPGGTWQWVHRYISFPAGCEYISHEIEVLDRRPSVSERDWPNRTVVNDTLGRDAHGKVFTLLTNIGAYRPIQLGPGFAIIKVRLSIVASCNEVAHEAMAKQFN